MIEGREISANVWVLRNGESGRNMGVILEGAGGGATLVNPGHLALEQEALSSFVSEMHNTVACLLFADEPEHTDMLMWPDAAFITPVTLTGGASWPAPGPGWELLAPEQGVHLGLYSRKERILFVGQMLRKDSIPDLKHGTQSYLDALDRIEALNIKLLVPVTGPEARGKRDFKTRIDHDRSYTMSVLRHVITSRASNVPLMRVLQVAARIYEDYPDLEAHLRNIRYAWDAMVR